MTASSSTRNFARFIPSEEVGTVSQWTFGQVGDPLLPQAETLELPAEIAARRAGRSQARAGLGRGLHRRLCPGRVRSHAGGQPPARRLRAEPGRGSRAAPGLDGHRPGRPAEAGRAGHRAAGAGAGLRAGPPGGAARARCRSTGVAARGARSLGHAGDGRQTRRRQAARRRPRIAAGTAARGSDPRPTSISWPMRPWRAATAWWSRAAP
jgi:hypothetical protein